MGLSTSWTSPIITAAVSPNVATPQDVIVPGSKGTLLEAEFFGGTGGTNVTAYVQSTTDDGATWFDVACFQFANTPGKKAFDLSNGTPVTTEATLTNGSLSANTCVDGIIGDRLRVLYGSTGTYSGSTQLTITATARN
jgi:hypothetical protein